MPKKCIVTSCIVVKSGKILLIHHKKLKKWMYPGGHVGANETPQEAVVRETKEETGYRVRVVGAAPLGLRGHAPAKELVLPFAILYEDVRYKTGRHMHFDMVYFGMAEGRRGSLAEGESQMLKWVSESEVDGIDTYYSIKKILKYSFRAIRGGRLSK